ncbi:MAG: response regulator [Bosea sp. (in: a-proteobacteria)]|uniref:response regulator n=1 Tax=Bosea sp. (in: a-proteobacteria) TaxID=1871050 RepID=UPI0027333193|nr:response regulator [Bosea sp. (in: a-proteobacteria)]MDP3255641.1 response regulator [Bosea sp. (in: a-proteobacteria)]MDP3320572.1 response regulator [Bosea sp. (in: a-proteobacteria)]
MKIMIVDDNRTYPMVLRSVVNTIGNHHITVFSNPLEALEAAANIEFDFVLVDDMMPEMDGVACIQALRQMPNHRDLPIVMVTTAEERETRLAALDAGATDFLHKPIEPVELRVRVLSSSTAACGANWHARSAPIGSTTRPASSGRCDPLDRGGRPGPAGR